MKKVQSEVALNKVLVSGGKQVGVRIDITSEIVDEGMKKNICK